MQYEYIFGPVMSRRLGRSLGVDCIPFKTCNLNCVYCQLGKTTVHTNSVSEYISAEKVTAELVHYLRTDKPDFITLGGSGEPLLNKSIDKIIKCIHELSDIPVCLITNGVLLADKEVRERAALAAGDLILPSLDAADEETFSKINKPSADCPSIHDIVNGLRAYCIDSRSEMRLEIFLLKGINDSGKQLENIIQAVDFIKPACVQLNTICRPVFSLGIYPVENDVLNIIQGMFSCPAEIIARQEKTAVVHEEINTGCAEEASDAETSAVIGLLKRHPAGYSEIAEGLNISLQKVNAIVGCLEKNRHVKKHIDNGRLFFSCNN